MKIIFCDNSLRELLNFRKPIIEAFLKDGVEVVALCPPNHDIPKLDGKFKYVPIKLNRGGMNPIKDLLYFIRLTNLYFSEKADYIFHYTIKPNVYGTFAARLLGIKSTMMVAGLGYIFTNNDFRCKIGRVLYKMAMKLANHVIVLNEANYELLLKTSMVRKEKLILLKGGEGIDLNRFDS